MVFAIENRVLITPAGGYILVYVATPIEVCEQRDRKGLCAKARAGIIKEFKRISDPYVEPENADVTIDATDITPEEAAHEIILFLQEQGYLSAHAFGGLGGRPR